MLGEILLSNYVNNFSRRNIVIVLVLPDPRLEYNSSIFIIKAKLLCTSLMVNTI